MLKRLFGKKSNETVNTTESLKATLPDRSENTGQSKDVNDLRSWWQSTFSSDERVYLESKAQELRDSSLVMGIAGGRHSKRFRFLTSSGEPEIELHNLARYLNTPQDRHLARRLIDKAETYYSNDPEKLHFTYTAMIPIYYRDRDTDGAALPRTIQACERMISFAAEMAKIFDDERRERTAYLSQRGSSPPDDTPGQQMPIHMGFQQLAIIREKERNYTEAIRLSADAMGQGWQGDWEKRIARCEKRLANQRKAD